MAKILHKIYNKTKNIILDFRSTYYLRKVSEKKYPKGKRIKIGFIAFEPETWDKLNPIYNEFRLRDDIECKIIIVPSYDQELRLITTYGKELQYFKKIDKDAVLAYNHNSWIDISKDGYDFIFYQDPYNVHMPKTLVSDTVVKFSKICYIPYGFSGSKVFTEGATNKDFFRNVYFGFMDTEDVFETLNNRYKSNVSNGIQHFYKIGYPVFESFLKFNRNKKIETILWAPRWSYDSLVGGSHFLEYRNNFLNLAKRYKNIHFILRPHPMMFKNLIDNKMISESDVNEYIKDLKKNNIELSIQNDVSSDFERTDVLISDYSSIIPMFFLMNKPIIYCPSQIKLNQEYEFISDGMYVSNNWELIEKNVELLINENDSLSNIRTNHVEILKQQHVGSTDRIVNVIINDFEKNVI